MKRVLLIFTILLFSILPSFAQKSKYRIDGKSYNKQIYDENNNQITNFRNWELIDGLYVSPDNSKMLVYHRPDKAKAYLISLYDLNSKKLIAEREPGWACSGIRWGKDYLIYIWGTSGGGIRYEYRNYNNLNVEKELNAYLFFEDDEDNILIEYFHYTTGSHRHLIFYDLYSGTVIKDVYCIEVFEKRGIFTDAMAVKNIKKIVPRKYEFEIEYYYRTEGKEDDEYSIILEVEI